MAETLHDRLFRIFSNPDFLSSENLRNEAPLYIQPYEVQQEDEMASIIRSLTAGLGNKGVQVKHIEMFEFCLDILRESGRFDKILAKEPDLTSDKMLQLLQGRLDLKREVIPRLEKILQTSGLQLTFLSGFGHLYPFLRTHNIIECLYTVLPKHPVVFFFPGEYTYSSRTGSRLCLFGQESSGHYRAINLDTYGS